MNRQREQWVDLVKLTACILVALGHFCQGIVSSGIVPNDGLYHWFNQTVYFIHVPLFFICSGYLYQNYGRVDSFSAWKQHLIRKGITLGIPYIFFSVAAWLLKEGASGSVNNVNGALLPSLFVTPAAPYWYLYVLFFVFALTPTFQNKRMQVFGLLGAIALKLYHICVGEAGPYLFSKLAESEIWFVLGMCLAMHHFPEQIREKKCRGIGVGMLAAFLAGSILLWKLDAANRFAAFAQGIVGCFSIVLLMCNWNPGERTGHLLQVLSGYMMPVYLMHTIFAAGIRILLMKLGILNPAAHILLGISASFAGPILAYEIMKRMKLDILLYPGRYIKLSKK